MIADNEAELETAAWLICDHATIRKYGLGYAKPAPVPIGMYVRSGYLQTAPTLQKLAQATGIDQGALEQTVSEYNEGAVTGEDREFGRGSTAFNRFLGDPENKFRSGVGAPRAQSMSRPRDPRSLLGDMQSCIKAGCRRHTGFIVRT